MTPIKQIERFRIVPVIVPDSIEHTLAALGALCDGGLPIAEITLRTAAAPNAIRLGLERFPQMLIGAGTVLSAEQAQTAIDLGVKFIISPGFSAEVARVCEEMETLYIPGCVTPTEIMAAMAHKLDTVKFYPADMFGGTKMIKSLSSVFTTLKFLPTGGINDKNILEYLEIPNVVACGGSWIVRGTPEEIREKAELAVTLVRRNIL